MTYLLLFVPFYPDLVLRNDGPRKAIRIYSKQMSSSNEQTYRKIK